jgi:subtilisin family serine protease
VEQTLADTERIVRLKWPGPEAFESPEALQRALARRAERVEGLLEGRSRRPRPRLTFGRVFRRIAMRGAHGSFRGASGGAGAGGPAADGGERVSEWRREGVGAWGVEADGAAADALEESASDLLRFDHDRGFAFPPPQAAVADKVAGHQLERIGVDSFARAKGRGKGVRVAILDSGIDLAHPELSALELDRKACWSWYRPHAPERGKFGAIPLRTGQAYETRHYHGTAVAGLVAGGTSGVAPEATLLAHNVYYKRPRREVERLGWTDANGVRHQPDATLKSVEGALMYATASNTDVIVISLGTQGYDPCFEEEIENIHSYSAKTLIVVAAGNSGPGTHLSPGDYRGVLTVGAIDWHGRFWTRTSGARLDLPSAYVKPDLYAPGADLELPVPSAVSASGYLRKSGTSFAAPIVGGVAALIIGWYRDRGKTLAAEEVREHLLETATDVTVPAELGGTGKRLDVGRALAALKPSVPT